MYPTLRRLDILSVEALAYSAIRPGDVIVFSPAEISAADSLVVHRVRQRLAAGLMTQGDNCAAPDDGLVHPGQVVGRVRWAIRNGRRRRVCGGRAGQVWLAWVRVRRAGLKLIVAAYRRVGHRIWPGRWWRPSLARVRVQTPEGALVKFVSRGETVGEWRPQKGDFWCRKAYEPILRESGNGRA